MIKTGEEAFLRESVYLGLFTNGTHVYISRDAKSKEGYRFFHGPLNHMVEEKDLNTSETEKCLLFRLKNWSPVFFLNKNKSGYHASWYTVPLETLDLNNYQIEETEVSSDPVICTVKVRRKVSYHTDWMYDRSNPNWVTKSTLFRQVAADIANEIRDFPSDPVYSASRLADNILVKIVERYKLVPQDERKPDV